MRCLFLITNNVCDIKCSYCFYTTGYQQRSLSRIRQSEAKNFACKIAHLDFDKVILTGGDPLYSKWKEATYILINELKKRKLAVVINTSASFLTDDDLDTIIRTNVDRVDISIDSHIPEIHNSQRGRYYDAVYAIKGLVLRGYQSIATTTVVTKKNASTLLETIHWIKGLGVTDIRIQRVFIPTKNDCKAKVKNDIISDAMKAVIGQLNTSHINGYIKLTQAAFNGDVPSLSAVCCMGKQYFVCSAIGDLTPCFHRLDINLGNLFTDSILKIKSRLQKNILTDEKGLPKCFGAHCVSLFDNSKFWKHL